MRKSTAIPPSTDAELTRQSAAPSERKPRKARRRSAGEGSVYEVDAGTAKARWRGAVTWTDAAGVRHRRTVTGKTSAIARTRLDGVRRQLGLGATDSDGPETVGDFLDSWLLRSETLWRPATFRQRESIVRVYLKPAFGKLPLTKLGPERIELALAAFQRDGRPEKSGKRPVRPISGSSALHVRSVLRLALREAERAGKIARNPASAARPPRAVRKPIVYLSARDVRKLLDATAELPEGPIYALAVTTGLRLGECLGLTWADLEDGKLSVRRALARGFKTKWELSEPKTIRARRTIPLPLEARKALETQRTRQRFAKAAAGSAWQDRVGLVFTNAIGSHLDPQYVSVHFRHATVRAGVPTVRFHDLRHTAATTMLAQGVPLAVISDWLGHSNYSITADLYAAVVPELHLAAADAIDRAFGVGS